MLARRSMTLWMHVLFTYQNMHITLRIQLLRLQVCRQQSSLKGKARQTSNGPRHFQNVLKAQIVPVMGISLFCLQESPVYLTDFTAAWPPTG